MEKQINGVMNHDRIGQSLDKLWAFIETELEEKKELIKEQKQIIETLKEEISRKDQAMVVLEKNLRECKETTEGNRQLINKLLGDISKLQNDVDWYKRTYEKRSLLGVLREKIFKERK
jgi:septal ring factor EnvC (AmiA/AmiB activator)